MTRKPLRVLQVCHRFWPEIGGIETHVYETSRRVAGAAFEVTVLTTDRSRALPPMETFEGVTLRRVKAWPRSRDYYVAPGIWKEIVKGDWDIVHVQGFHTAVPIVTMFAALRSKTPFVVTGHTGGHSSPLRARLRGLQWWLLGPLLRRADALIGVSRFETQVLCDRLGIPGERVHTVRNGTSIGTALPAPSHEAQGPVILSVGRMERYKGHHRLIQAMPQILRRAPDARASILGNGPYEEELRTLARDLGVAEQVSFDFVPGVHRDDLAGRMTAADLIVLFSDYEAHPVAVMEAVALGRPVLVSATSGLTELAEEGLCSSVSASATTSDIAEAVLAELANPRKPASVGDLPSWDGNAMRLREIYSEVLGLIHVRG